MLRGFQTVFVNVGWSGSIYSLAGVSNPPALDSSPELSVRCSCLVVPDIALMRRGPTHTEQNRGSDSIGVVSGEQKWGAALGRCLGTRRWYELGLLKKTSSRKRRDGECALCFFCEDHIVMQREESRCLFTPFMSTSQSSRLWCWGLVCHC